MLTHIRFFYLILLFISGNLFSQSLSIKGVLKDSIDHKHLQHSVVAVLTTHDSVLVNFSRADKDGKFIIPQLKEGQYILMATHPLMGDYFDRLELSGSLDMGTIYMTPKSKLLAEVIIKSGSPIKIKGDTTIYTADSFKVSANANVEELLRKLPGIQVDKNGTIKAMGETVQKVLVDGEEFFGDDPGMAVKNLRADAVKEVQVFDKKSDAAEFTGIDDGQTQKTINLKLKEDKKKGYFGKVDVAGGLLKNIDDRFNNNLMYSTFKGKRKLSMFVLNGNTGQDGLNWQDSEKFGGNDDRNMEMSDDGGMMVWWGNGTVDEEPNVNTENGFITNVNVGLQYTNKWKDKVSMNFSPKFNSQIYDNAVRSNTQTQLGDSIITETARQQNHVNRNNFKNNLVYDFKLDSLGNNTLKVTTKANFYHTESREVRWGNTVGNTGTLKNTSSSSNDSKVDKQAYTTNILFKHKFKKARRTLSLSTNWSLLQSKIDGLLLSENQSYFNGLPSYLQAIDQQREGDKYNNQLLSQAVYTEPLGKKFALEMGYQFSITHSNNQQIVYAYQAATDKYDAFVDSLSNKFKQQVAVHRPSFKFNYSHKKVKYSFGSGFGITHFNLADVTLQKQYNRNFTNLFPTANLVYTYKGNHNIRINYSGYNTQPTINQLQPLRNNNNFFNEYIGNPALKPSFTNNINLSHNGYNFLKNRWMYQSVWANFTSNAITNSRTINLDSGKTITQPINTSGNLNLGFWSGFGFKLKKLNIDVDINPNLNYTRFIDIVNGVNTNNKNLSGGISFSVNKRKDKVYEVGISNRLNYNSNNSTAYNNRLTFITNIFSLGATVYVKKVWQLENSIEFFNRQKTPQFASNLSNQLWNATLKRTFKKDVYTAYIQVRDLLNQNTGIDRKFYGNTSAETINDRLRRYWMIGFAWNFKNKSSAKEGAAK
ncbi:MAG: hypothetical protein RIR12_2391 [Bacteroidota bacterium]